MKKIFMIIFAILIGLLMFASMSNIIDEKVGMCVSMTLAVIFTIIVAISAYKHDLKAVVVLMVILMIIGVGLLSFNVIRLFVKVEDKTFYLSLETDNSERKKLFSYENRTFYTYNVSNVQVNKSGISYGLEDAIKNNIIKVEDILSESIPSENTVGYKKYYNGGIDSIKNDELSIMVCGEKIIFCPYSMNFNESLCDD